MKTQIVQMTGATMIGGELVSIGEMVEVTEREARDLIGRGRAIAQELEAVIGNVEAVIDDVKQVVKAGRKGKA